MKKYRVMAFVWMLASAVNLWVARRFASLRHRGEWFRNESPLTEFMASIWHEATP